MTYTEGRVRQDRDGDGTWILDMSWPLDCHGCVLTDNFGSGVVLEDNTVTDPTCGNASHCNLDGQYQEGGTYDSNTSQRTIGLVCTAAGGTDPVNGTYIGHGTSEETSYGEGSYFAAGGSFAGQNTATSTTWVR